MALSEEMKLAIKLTASNTTQQAFGQLNQSLSGLKNTVLAVAGAVGGALVFKDLIDTLTNTNDQVVQLMDNFGMTAPQASKLDFALKVVGSSADEFTVAVAFLNKKIVDALPLLEKGEDDFTKWGISILNAGGGLRGTGDILLDLRDKMRAAGSAQAAMAMGADLLGKTSRNLTEFMQLTDRELEEMGKDAEEMGQVFDDAGVKDVRAFTRELRKAELGLEGIKLGIARTIIPLLRQLVHWFREASGAVKSFGEFLQRPLGIIKDFAARIGKFFEDIKTVGFGKALEKLVEDAVEAAKKILPKLGEELDKLGPVGWALKILLALAAVELGLAVAASIPGLIAAAALKIPGVSLAPAGARLPLAYTLSSLLLFSIALTDFINDVREGPGDIQEKAHRVARAIILSAGLVLVATAAFAASVPIGIAVGVGLLLGLAAVEFGPAIGEIFKDLGLRFLRWIIDNIAPHLPFPLSLVGNVIKAIINIVPEFRVGESATPFPSVFQGPPRSEREGQGGRSSLPAVDTLPLAEQQAWLRQTFPENFGGGGAGLLELQHGGIFHRPTAALIAESGAEAVIPLGRNGAGWAPTINVTVSGNVTRSEQELAEIVAGEILRRMRGTGQSMGSPTSLGNFY